MHRLVKWFDMADKINWDPITGPDKSNLEETISTLRFASLAKFIKNKAKINEDPKDALLRRFQDQIRDLKRQLEAVEGDGDGDGTDNELNNTHGMQNTDWSRLTPN